MSANTIFNLMSGTEHEQIAYCYDQATGLKAIIGIHNTVLGPALGGTRMWAYANENDALVDVLRLSRGMTYKAAISGLNLGGGKAVIIGDSRKDKSEAMWRRYGKFVDSLAGKYITAEDVGTSTKDIEYISQETNHVAGKPDYLGGGGDPSPVTAYGVYLGIKASVKELTGNDDLEGKKVAVQGVGHVGQNLVEYLVKDGAKVTICDINEMNAKECGLKYNVQIVKPEDIYSTDMDIYAPCALGATVNSETLQKLKCSIISGAANNQLKDEVMDGEAVRKKGILYAPDFLINAGGLINCYSEVQGDYNRKSALAMTEIIYERTLEIYAKAKTDNITTHAAACRVAEERIAAIAKLRTRL